SELHRLLAVLCLGAHLEAGALEQLAQVEADDRLVFGYEDADAPSLSPLPGAHVCGMVLSASIHGFPSGSWNVASLTMSGMTWVSPSKRTPFDSRCARAPIED